MTRVIFKQFERRSHDNDLLTIQDRIGEIKLERYFRTFTGYVSVFPDLFLRDVMILSIIQWVTGENKNEAVGLEIYCVGTSDWIESPIDEKKLLNIVAISA